MSDLLRDRIAEIVDEHQLNWDNGEGNWRCFCNACTVPGGWAKHVADALVVELGLMRDPTSTVAFCRYVTRWQPNERFAPYCNRCGIPHTDTCRRPADA
jgi:hypothetical protein